MKNALKVVVAGEVDAGKSTLIGRLLYDTGSLHEAAMHEISRTSSTNGYAAEFAYLLDGFEEERRDKLTIDTTQVFCHNGKSGFLFIDVPGHAELLKNMLCGSSYSQAAILVADTNRPLEDGTVKHLNILKFLGIERIVVVLNKMDVASFSKEVFECAKGEIFKFFRSNGMKAEYFIPVSALRGDNLVKNSTKAPWYKGPCLIAALDSLAVSKRKSEDGEFYFPIQDVYSRGGNPVFVGTILSGKIRKFDTVYVSPEAKAGRITAIRVFRKNKLLAQAPESIGLELAGVAGLRRGQIICRDNLLRVSLRITAKIFCVQPIRTQDKLFFNCATQQTMCRIKQINRFYSAAVETTPGSKAVLGKSCVAEVVIITQEPVVVKRFCHVEALGRFVLRKSGEICAVGVIP